MNRFLGMRCEQCNVVESVRDGTGMEEPNPHILTDAEREQCVNFALAHVHHRGMGLCIFDVQNLAQA